MKKFDTFRQSFCKKNFKYFVFKHWITLREGVEWLYHPKRGGKYVQRRMYNQIRGCKPINGEIFRSIEVKLSQTREGMVRSLDR